MRAVRGRLPGVAIVWPLAIGIAISLFITFVWKTR
jgi:hypothetical protein